ANIMSGCKLMIAAIPSRTTGWSSTHNTRIFPASFMSLSRPVFLLAHLFLWACSAAVYPALAFESLVFRLRNAMCLRGANRTDAQPPGTEDAPEQIKKLPCLCLRDFGWKDYRLGARFALSFLLFRSD